MLLSCSQAVMLHRQLMSCVVNGDSSVKIRFSSCFGGDRALLFICAVTLMLLFSKVWLFQRLQRLCCVLPISWVNSFFSLNPILIWDAVLSWRRAQIRSAETLQPVLTVFNVPYFKESITDFYLITQYRGCLLVKTIHAVFTEHTVLVWWNNELEKGFRSENQKENPSIHFLLLLERGWEAGVHPGWAASLSQG